MAKAQQGFISLPSNTGGPSTQTFEGIPEGMNLALPPQDIDDTAARYLQDILLDVPGLIRRRGPLVNSAEGFPDAPFPASGMVFTLDPLGNNRLGILNGDISHGQLSFLNSAFNSIGGTYPWNGFLPTLPPASPYNIVDAKASLGNGMWIGTSSQYDSNSPTQSLAFWRGGISSDYTTGNITVSRGSPTVTGAGTSWIGNVTPGMFLFANTDDGYTLTYVGVVQTVLNNTTLILEAASPYPATAMAYKFTSIRGFEPRITTGRVTVAAAATIVTGANTKFTSQLVTGGIYNLYRASDNAWVGKVASVTNDTSLTLAAGAAVAVTNGAFFMLRADGNWSIATNASPSKMGFLNAVYAERQWYANNGGTTKLNTRIYFSEVTGPEDVDLALFDGNYIDVDSTTNVNSPITAVCPAYNALLVFKENETFGIYGNTETTFNVQKIEDDGVLSAGSVQAYGGGVLWAGRAGIYFYDGVQTTNIVAGTLGNWYKELVRSINPRNYRMWSGIMRDHYFLFMERCNPTVPVIKGNSSTETSYVTLVINMVSKAPTVFSNFAIRGAVQMPQSTGLETLFLVNTPTNGKLVSGTHIFNDSGNDAIITDVTYTGIYGSGLYTSGAYGGSGLAGPDFYIETKKYNAGDSMLLKLWSQLLVNYECSGDALNVDAIVGLNNVGATISTNLPATIYTWDTFKGAFTTWAVVAANQPTWLSLITAVFKPRRVRFLKRSQNFAFRIWQNSSAVNNVTMGPFQLGFKRMRPGRI